jgi:hypothetical protein
MGEGIAAEDYFQPLSDPKYQIKRESITTAQLSWTPAYLVLRFQHFPDGANAATPISCDFRGNGCNRNIANTVPCGQPRMRILMNLN